MSLTVFQSRDPVLTVTSSSSSRPPVFSFPGYLAFGAGSSSSPAQPAAALAPGPAAPQTPVKETHGQMEMETEIPTTVEQEVLDIKEEDEVKENNRWPPLFF